MDEGVLTLDSHRISINFIPLFVCRFELLLKFFKLIGMVLFRVLFLSLENLALSFSLLMILLSFDNLGFNVINVLNVLFLVRQHPPHLLVNISNIFLYLLLLVLFVFDLLKEIMLFFFEI